MKYCLSLGVIAVHIVFQCDGIGLAKVKDRQESGHDLGAAFVALKEVFQPFHAPEHQLAQDFTGLAADGTEESDRFVLPLRVKFEEQLKLKFLTESAGY